MRALLLAEPGSHPLLEEVLQRRGHQLSVVRHPDDAVALQRREAFPLVFVEVSAAAQERLPALAGGAAGAAVVALVDEAHPEELDDAVAAGATDWMQDTVSRDLLEARIAVLERAVAHREEDERLRARLGVVERERARLDEDLHALLDASPDPIAIHRGQVIMYANPAAARSFGFPTAEAMVGVTILDLVHPDDHREVRSRIRRVVATGEPAPLREGRFLRHDGAELVGEAYSFLIRFGREPAVVTVGRDLTEARGLEQQLAHSERLAAIGTMTAAIAHELKNPLTYVIFNLADLCRRLPSLADRLSSDVLERLEQRVDAALEGVERLRAIAQDLSQFARSGDETLTTVDLGQVLEGVIRMAGPELKELDLETSLGPMPAVRGNDLRLSQVFLNLLINAAQAVRERELRQVRVSSATDPEDGWAVVEVRDSGGGIAPTAVSRVFEPYYTTKPSGVGTGLGLSVARTIVARLAGEISVESELGVGTVFRVRLPPAVPG